MAAKDKRNSFDFVGVYTTAKEHELIEYDIDDGRHVRVEFKELPQGVRITETFEPENKNPEEMQRSGWRQFWRISRNTSKLVTLLNKSNYKNKFRIKKSLGQK